MVVRGSRVSESLLMVMRRAKDVGSEAKDLKASERAGEGVMPDRIVLESETRVKGCCVRLRIFCNNP